jgi:rhodanese-related sulfurtransferase
MSIESQVPHVTCEHLQKLRADEDEHIVLDLRDFNEFEAGHIAGSHSVPRKELSANIHNVVPTKEHKVIVIIGPTDESEIEKVHVELVELGYEQVEVLAGGFDRYCEIAPLEIEPELTELTPEERGFTGEGLTDVDPEGHDNEPLY